MQENGFCGVPDLELYLNGIQAHGFGGTCYSNNPHFCDLLQGLGYQAALCGADMGEPDVHTAIIVRIDGGEFLVDMGYAAPFGFPLPRDLGDDLEIRLGNEKWVLKPQDKAGRSRVQHHRKGEVIHGYVVKPQPRRPEFFRSAVDDSYRCDATFMNAVRAVRFGDGWSCSVCNLNLIRATGATCEIRRLAGPDELVRVIEEEFEIPRAITREALVRNHVSQVSQR